MKKQTGIWIDGKQAVLVSIVNEQETVDVVESDIENRVHHDAEGDKGSFMGHQHISHEKTFEERKKHQTDDYLDRVVQKIAISEEVYIFGPAETKLKLKDAIESNKSSKINITAVEACDHITNNQIVAKVKDHFKIQK